ncbi:hypothetical protein MtrunA17_Chr3g0108511 [Medicago truncatula]|uniref:Uncharacterized protein n=1 Tax=Medicago truncatula TaxID=3880 RepID=A0A396IQV6_MEDTR|nr:hypothetical protein MtrunA17_Chr3g0108511 [Medicago truncatula]
MQFFVFNGLLSKQSLEREKSCMHRTWNLWGAIVIYLEVKRIRLKVSSSFAVMSIL